MPSLQKSPCQELGFLAARCFVLGALFFSMFANAAYSQQADQAAIEEADAKEKVARPTIDLGFFRIKDLRPTRNETAKLTFKMHLALADSLSAKQVEQLEKWKHRLRDQVIIAIRTLEIKDFQEADLSRLRRKVLIRANRLFRAKLAEETLFTEYLFRTH